MEFSHVSGDAEECHSSESGWTMYIGSPIHSDEDDDNDIDEDNGNDNSVKPSEESDDSIASDASSGRSRHRKHSWRSGKGMIGPAMADIYKHQVRKDDDHDDGGKRCCFLRKEEAEDPMEKNGFERRKKEKRGSVFTAKGDSVVVAAQITQSCEKEKKNSWFGKGK